MDTSDETWTPFDFLFERISIETIAKEEEGKKEPASRYGALFVAIRVGQTKRVALATIFPRTLDGAKEHQHVFHDRRVWNAFEIAHRRRPTDFSQNGKSWVEKKLSAYWRRGHRAESIITPTGRPAASRIPSFFSACLHKYQICVCRELKPKRTRGKKEIKVTKAVLYRTSLVINM